MKRLTSIIMMILAAATNTLLAQESNILYIPEVDGVEGRSVNIPVELRNSNPEITAMQFFLSLPEEILDVDTSSAFLTERASDHSLQIAGQGDGKYLILLFSPTNSPLSANAGAVLKIPCTVRENSTELTEFPITIENAVLSDRTGNNVLSLSQSGLFRIKKSADFAPEDVSYTVSEISPGESFDISYRVTNAGAVDSGEWKEKLYLVTPEEEEYYLGTFDPGIFSIPAGGSVERSVNVQLASLPGIEGKVAVRARIVPASDESESASYRDNNVSTSTNRLNVRKVLALSFPSLDLREKSGSSMKCMVSRSGNWKEDQTFNIVCYPQDSRLLIPESITIPKKQSGAYFVIRVVDNDEYDVNNDFTLTVSGGGYDPLSSDFSLIDDELPELTLSGSTDTVREGEDFVLTVERTDCLDTEAILTLSCDVSSRFSYPATTIMSKGSGKVEIPVKTIDNDVVEMSVIPMFTVKANGYEKDAFALTLLDNDTPELELTLTPDKVSEEAGVMAVQAKLRRLSDPGSKIKITFSDDSDGSVYYHKKSLTFDKGVTELEFPLGVIDNNEKDGDRTITITAGVYITSCSCSATSGSAGATSARLEILDNDGAALTLKASQSTLLEGDTSGIRLTVRRNTPPVEPLEVRIESDGDDFISYPSSVIIPAGKDSATIEVSAPSNDIRNDDRTISFTAKAQDYSTGCCWIMLSDRTLPDASISAINVSEENLYKGESATLTVTLKNEGVDILPEATRIDIYIDGNSVTPLYTSRPLSRNEEEDLRCILSFDKKIGKSSIYAAVNENRSLKELNYYNNQSPRIEIQVNAPYSATVVSDKATYNKGESINLSGRVVGKNISGQPVEIYLINGGLRQTLQATTDETGAYATVFVPYSNQSGHFEIGACYPGEGGTTSTASFDILGLDRVGKTILKQDIYIGESKNGSFEFRNTSGISLSGVTARVVEAPENCKVNVTCPSVIAGNGDGKVEYSIKPGSLTDGSNYQTIRIAVETTEGAVLETPVYYYCLSPYGVLKTDCSLLSTKMIKGTTRDYPLVIYNQGDGPTGEITLASPAWISLEGDVIPSLEGGESVRITLRLTPEENFQLNSKREGQIALNCENGQGFALPFSIETVSETKGTLIIDATDEYTYHTAEKPHLAGAQVMIQHPATKAAVASGTTGQNGIFSVELPEGYYLLTVSADKHRTYSGYVIVEPGDEPTYEIVVLNYIAHSFEFTVEEYEESDDYEISLVTRFETNVPVPVVIIDGPDRIDGENMTDGESRLLQFTLTNHGLITAKNNTFILPEDSNEWRWEALAYSEPFDLLPKESITVPVKVTRHLTGGAEDLPKKSGQDMMTSFQNCMAIMKDAYQHMCGEDWTNNESAKKLSMKMCGDQAIAGSFFEIITGGLSGNGGTGGTGGGTPSHGNSNSGNHTSTDKEPQPYNMERTMCNPCWADFADKNYDRATSWLPGGKYIADARNKAYEQTQGKRSLPEKVTASDLIPLGKVRRFLTDELKKRIPDGKAKDAVSEGLDFWNDYCDYLECTPELKNRPQENNEPADPAPKKSRGVESWVTDYMNKVKLLTEQFNYYLEGMNELFGDPAWMSNNDPSISAFIDIFSEMEEWDIDECMSIKPASITEAQLRNFVERMNNTIDGTGDNRCDLDYFIEKIMATEEADNFANEQGYKYMSEFLADEQEAYLKNVNEMSSSVCASISIAFDQSVSMTRQAFHGYLKVFNGDDVAPMENLVFNLDVRNTMTGKQITPHEMEVDVEKLEVFEGESELGAPWELAPEATGKVTVRFIPTRYAAPEKPVEYSFGGTVSYLDPITGFNITEKLMPVMKTVNPSPILDMTYFLQRDVYGDDPLTEETEPSQPAEMALVINNKGYGDASNMSIVTRQPRIVDNEKGLATDISIVSSQLNGGDHILAFDSDIPTDIGPIMANESALLQWWLQSSLLGHFTDYDVSFNHLSGNGNEDLSLIDEVTIHELIRGFTVSDVHERPVRGFLANDIEDKQDMPDHVYLSDGSEAQPLNIAENLVMSPEKENCYIIHLSPSTTGWNYGSVPDLTGGFMIPASAFRMSDNAEIPIDNFWQTSVTLKDGKDPVHENLLHTVANLNKDESYVVTFIPRPDIELDVTGMNLVYDETYDTPFVREVEITFSKEIDPDSFTIDDLRLFHNGSQCDLKDTELNSESDTKFNIHLGELASSPGSYELKILTGNILDKEGDSGKVSRSVSWSQDIVSGILSLSSPGNIEIYPLPMENHIFIKGDFTIIRSIEIVNMTGMSMMFNPEENNSLDVSGLSPGIYVVRIRTENGVFVEKAIKK